MDAVHRHDERGPTTLEEAPAEVQGDSGGGLALGGAGVIDVGAGDGEPLSSGRPPACSTDTATVTAECMDSRSPGCLGATPPGTGPAR